MKIVFLILTLCILATFYFLIYKEYSSKKLFVANLVSLPVVVLVYIAMQFPASVSYSRPDAPTLECVHLLLISLIVLTVSNMMLIVSLMVIGSSTDTITKFYANFKDFGLVQGLLDRLPQFQWFALIWFKLLYFIITVSLILMLWLTNAFVAVH